MSFHNQNTPGQLIERIDGDVANLANFFSDFVFRIVGSLILLFGVLGLLYWENWHIGAALTVYAIIGMTCLFKMRSIAVPQWKAARQASSDLFGFLEELRVAGLTYQFADSTYGIQDVDFAFERGTFNVVTGRIGSGKTTLLRTLQGLLSPQSGTVYWNGQAVDNPASFFVPPRSAYTSQIPWLFSASLRENLLMGMPESETDLDAAIHAAVLEKDLVDFDDGLDTLVGPKGVRLSGGQIQRTAAARMFVRDPELYIFDDLSSALDVDTEKILWERLFAQRQATCLVVSHRRPALHRADQVIVLKDGRIEDRGSLNELLERCEEMQRLWKGDWGDERSDAE